MVLWSESTTSAIIKIDPSYSAINLEVALELAGHRRQAATRAVSHAGLYSCRLIPGKR